jgi:hypothetical protein
MPRALLHNLAQAWIADRLRRPQHDAPTRAATDARHLWSSRRPSRPRAPGRGGARADRGRQRQRPIAATPPLPKEAA